MLHVCMRMAMLMLMLGQVSIGNYSGRIMDRTRRRDIIQEFRIIKWSRVIHTLIILCYGVVVGVGDKSRGVFGRARISHLNLSKRFKIQ